MSLIEEKTLADHDINVRSIRQELELLEEQLHGRNEPQPSSTVTNENTVSRQAVIDTVRKIILGFFSDEDGVMNDTEKTLLSVSKAVCNGVRELPSAQPERKRGKWIDAVLPNDNGGLPVQVCDQCNTFFPLAYTGGGHHYCPNCGARMEESKE